MRSLFAGMCLAFVFVSACASTPEGPAQIDPPFPAPGTLGAAPHVYPVETGWFDGKAVAYYNLGANTPLNPDDPARVRVEPVWMFVSGENADGSPVQLEGQHNLFAATVGEADYSDLWQPHFVRPSADYAPGAITSAEALLASGLTIEKQAFFVNCPIVPAGSSLADSDLELKTAWVRDAEVKYFDFGPTSATPGKVYAFVTGFEADGSPRLVPGQHFVFDSTRGEAGYSDFWVVQWVRVAAGYQPDSVRTVSDIRGEIIPSTLVVNYPHRQP